MKASRGRQAITSTRRAEKKKDGNGSKQKPAGGDTGNSTKSCILEELRVLFKAYSGCTYGKFRPNRILRTGSLVAEMSDLV